MQDTAVNPQITYDNAYTYPAPGSAHPHGPVAIGGFTITNDADGNQVRTLGTGTSNVSQYLFDEENRLACANKGPQMPNPSCDAAGLIDFMYDHAGVRKVKQAATPTIYPNQFYTDIGGGSGNQFKHIFIGSERILTKKSRIAPDLLHWYYHPDHLGSTAMVTNEKSQLVDAIHYFPFGEVWLEERPSSLPEEFFFTAKEFDPETGFYNFGARYLDPRFSKWMTADPADRLDAGAPIIALNLYQYGRQNPLRYFDPTGAWELAANSCIPDRPIQVASSYTPSWREQVVDWFTALGPGSGNPIYDTKAYARQQIARGLLGGRGFFTDTGSMPGVLEFFPPVGVPLALNDAYREGSPEMAAMAVIPVPGGAAERGVARGIESTAARYFRGAKPGEVVSFTPKPGEFRVDKETGFVKPTHGVSVYDNPASVRAGGRLPYEVDLDTVPSSLQIKQRGERDPHHYEIMPKPGANLTPEQYIQNLECIRCK
jgi:RHS repeat-associated protein